MSSSPSPNDQRAIALPESPESLQQARPSAADEIDSLLREGENDEGLSGGSSFSFSPSQVDGWGTPAIVGRPPGLGPMRSNELALVRLLCNKHSFSPYQREELEGLVEHAENPLLRDIRIYAKQCVIEKKIEEITSSAASYVVGPALMQNIRSIAVAVLLSPKLAAYKGDTPKDCVLKVLLSRDRLHIPNTYDHDANVSSTISTAIGVDLVQVRSSFKKIIGNSIKKKISIYDLAKLLVDGTRCVVTVPLCSKIALMRKIYIENNGSKYWDHVDARLELIRDKAEKDVANISRVLLGFLNQDKSLYGFKSGDRMAVSAGSWQQEVDDTISQTATGDAADE